MDDAPRPDATTPDASPTPPKLSPAPGQQASSAPAPVLPPVQTGMPPQPSAFRRGFGLGAGLGLGLGGMLLILSILGALVSGLIMMGMAGAAASVAGSSQASSDSLSTVWGKSSAAGTLRAIPVTGAIQTQGSDGLTLSEGTYGYEVADVLDGLTAEDADGVVLMMDTPGGTVTGSKAMADAVDRYRERTGKKVFAFVAGTSASGGMYTMAGADEIVADHGAIVGSVGVIMGPIERYRDVTSTGSVLGWATAGEITQEYITAGTGKDAGNPYRDLTADERAMLQTITDEMYDDFVTHVATKRGIDKATIVNELGAGMFTGQKAIDVGYIDAVMGREEALRHFAEAAGLDPDDTKLEQSTGPGLLESLLGAESRPWGVSLAAQPTQGQPARATASLCTDTMTPLLWSGSLAGVCR